jgi:hypothetical protein
LATTSYIFYFYKELKNSLMEKHFKRIEAAKYAKEGMLQEVVLTKIWRGRIKFEQ